jgi:hypothetical protein
MGVRLSILSRGVDGGLRPPIRRRRGRSGELGASWARLCLRPTTVHHRPRSWLAEGEWRHEHCDTRRDHAATRQGHAAGSLAKPSGGSAMHPRGGVMKRRGLVTTRGGMTKPRAVCAAPPSRIVKTARDGATPPRGTSLPRRETAVRPPRSSKPQLGLLPPVPGLLLPVPGFDMPPHGLIMPRLGMIMPREGFAKPARVCSNPLGFRQTGMGAACGHPSSSSTRRSTGPARPSGHAIPATDSALAVGQRAVQSRAVAPIFVPASLKDRLRRGQVVPFVGAGVSRPVLQKDGGPLFPAWRDLLLAGADRLAAEGKNSDAQIVRGYVEKGPKSYGPAPGGARTAVRLCLDRFSQTAVRA